MAGDKENIRQDIADKGVIEAGCEKGVLVTKLWCHSSVGDEQFMATSGAVFL